MNRGDDGTYSSGTDLSGEYQDLYDDYQRWSSTHINKETTRERLQSGVRYWLSFCETEGIDPLSAEENDVRIYIDEMVSEGLADTSITRRTATVSKYYHYLSTDPRQDVDIANPTEDISLPRDYDISNLSNYVRVIDREGRSDVIAPPRSDVEKLFEYPGGKRAKTRTRNELIIRLFWETALRADELSRVRLDKIDMDNREITVRSAKLNRKQHPDLYHRRVWWTSNLDYLMQRWIDKREEISGKSDYLLVGEDGDQLSPGYLSRIVKDSAHEAGIQEPLTRDSDGNVKQWLYTAHRLRHARISHLANETDMDLNHLRMMAGHAKFETTLSYVRTDWESARESYQQSVD